MGRARLLAYISIIAALCFVIGAIFGGTSETWQEWLGTTSDEDQVSFSASLSTTSMTLEASGASEAPSDTSTLTISPDELGDELEYVKVTTSSSNTQITLDYADPSPPWQDFGNEVYGWENVVYPNECSVDISVEVPIDATEGTYIVDVTVQTNVGNWSQEITVEVT